MSEQAKSTDSEEQSASTHFAFQGKMFQVPGAYFAMAKDTREPVFNVPLGGIMGSITIPTLRTEFKVEPESNDAKLLDVVEKSLLYVKEIRPGDSIPRELLDGTASWSVDESHKLLAKMRLTMQVVSWFTGQENVIVDAHQLEQIAGDPAIREKAQTAFGDIAEKIGIGTARKQEVIDRIDDLAREMSYIEGLRDYYKYIREIGNKLNRLVTVFRNDRGTIQEIGRMQDLLRRPLRAFDDMFMQVDAQTGEILAVLKNFDAQVKFIRDMRDQLHRAFLDWDQMVDKWEVQEPEATQPCLNLMKDTYRFLAQNFAAGTAWKLESAAMAERAKAEKAKAPKSEKEPDEQKPKSKRVKL